MLKQYIFQNIEIYRLRDNLIHSSLDTNFLVLDQNMPCDTNDDWLLSPWHVALFLQELSHFSRGINSIHYWHIEVSKYYWILEATHYLLLQLLKGFLAVYAKITLKFDVNADFE